MITQTPAYRQGPANNGYSCPFVETSTDLDYLVALPRVDEGISALAQIERILMHRPF